MRKSLIGLALSLLTMGALADNVTIDFSGDNTSSSYKTYDTQISIGANDTVTVFMARYAYFNSVIRGKGSLVINAGGERCYLGTAKGASWPDWTGFTGDVHVWPYPANSSSAGFYGIVMAHGGKAFSAEDIEGGLRSGKVNISMKNNRLILHKGATLCCEAHTSGSGFRIGELNTEEGSVIQGYMKKGTRPAYFLVGSMNTDATLAGTIAPPDNSDTHLVGIIKEGKGTYTITGNRNYISGAVRVLDGKVLVMNDREEAQRMKLRGATGSKPTSQEAVIFVFENGVLGGLGSVGGTVDNYGVIEPGDGGVGCLTLRDYASGRDADLLVRPASVLRFKVNSADRHDTLDVGGSVKYYNIMQDFSTNDAMPMVEMMLDEGFEGHVGDEFILLTAKGKVSQAGEWGFELKKPGRYTWELVEREADGTYQLSARITSLDDDTGGGSGPGDDPGDGGQMGAFYDDGIKESNDRTSLREYADRNNKWIGTAISTWKNDLSNENLSESREVALQFNMLVAENEMKFDALQPSRGQFNYSGADKLVAFAQRHGMRMRGHTLVWHSQQPEWISSDGKKNDKNWTREEALGIMRDHINNVMGHFKGKVMEWDVVNECLDDDQTTVRTDPSAYDLRQTVWQRAIGDDYIDSAFVYAHRADPTAELYLNDYGVELQGKAKAVAFYNLAVRLKNAGIPIDGVGLQCHFSIGDVDSVKLEKTIQRFADAGLKCIITELDMGIPSTSTEDQTEQARNYRVITDIVLNNDNCPSFVIWGLKDNDSWRNASNPLLYTSGLGKKPAFYAVRSALRHRWITDVETPVVRQQLTNGALYDLCGRRVETQHPRPGIYIKDGRKILVR